MEQPLVSVVIPFYSGKDWLFEAIKSVLNQTYKNIEVLVINDGSSENIDDIINKFKPRIRVIKKTNGGPASARNLGIKIAKGKYIAFLDSDDLWLPEKLEKQINFMEKTKYVWSHHSYQMFWENSKKSRVVDTSKYSGNVYRDTYISFKIQTSTVVIRKSILIENNIYFPNMRYGQDLEFFRRLSKLYHLGYVDGILSKFRIRGTNAGFRAKIQLYNRANTWENIKNNNELLKLLPKPIIFSYKLTKYLSKYVSKLDTIINSEKTKEVISKFLYVLPYSIFKIYSIK